MGTELLCLQDMSAEEWRGAGRPIGAGVRGRKSDSVCSAYDGSTSEREHSVALEYCGAEQLKMMQLCCLIWEQE